MTEQWKAEAAKRFIDTIVMRPQDLDDGPGTPLPEREPVTLADHAEKIYEANLRFVQTVVDVWTPGR